MSLTLHVRDSSVMEIIMDMAACMKAGYEEENKEWCLQIPEKLGSGYILGIQFSHGLGVIEYHCTLNQKIKIEHEKGVLHPLKLLFNREATILHKFDDKSEFREIRRLENAILSSIPKHNHVFELPEETPVRLYSIEINRKLFEEKVEDFMESMDDHLLELFRDVNGTNQFYHKEFYSLEIAGFLEEFSECDFSDFMKTVYREGKVYEILSHQLQQYNDDLKGPKERKIIRKATVEKVEKAAAILKADLDNPTPIVSLAKQVGLNQNLLQKGFKRMYKVSVNEYVRNLRIEKARELLETTDLNVTEVCYKIGLSSRSYFSKLFKEKYGLSPKDYYRQFHSAAAK
jgi:AraC-like DNA-binding protein